MQTYSIAKQSPKNKQFLLIFKATWVFALWVLTLSVCAQNANSTPGRWQFQSNGVLVYEALLPYQNPNLGGTFISQVARKFEQQGPQHHIINLDATRGRLKGGYWITTHLPDTLGRCTVPTELQIVFQLRMVHRKGTQWQCLRVWHARAWVSTNTLPTGARKIVRSRNLTPAFQHSLNQVLVTQTPLLLHSLFAL
jgi:hypothetical protein